MIDHNPDVVFIKRVLELAERAAALGEVPVGAMVLSGGEVIAEGWNRKETANDPFGHAEIMAIREAAAKTGTWRLADATLYISQEPCIMCCGAIVHARIKRVVYGCPDPKGGGAESLYRLLSDPRLNHRAEVVSGVCSDECAAQLRQFFSAKRV